MSISRGGVSVQNIEREIQPIAANLSVNPSFISQVRRNESVLYGPFLYLNWVFDSHSSNGIPNGADVGGILNAHLIQGQFFPIFVNTSSGVKTYPLYVSSDGQTFSLTGGLNIGNGHSIFTNSVLRLA